MGEKVLVAMSGGVDSSVAVMLLLEQGYEIVGITMKTWDYENSASNTRETGCCSLDSIHDARAVAVKAGIPHYVLDLRKEFEEKIISDFISEYMAGRTPNPCVLCNRLVKWEDLLKRADVLGCRYIATGHYASVASSAGRYYLQKGLDDWKDQSYVLWGLTQEQLARTLLPLGRMKKDDVKLLAEKYGFERVAHKSESYEICFVPDNDYRSFLKHRVKDLEEKLSGGNFVDEKGSILGKHAGYPFYTIGQRKGLNVAAGYPLYVKSIHPEENKVVLAGREALAAHDLTADSVNLMKYESLQQKQGLSARIRYKDPGAECEAAIEDGLLKIKFSKAVSAITPGQSVVVYEGNDLVCGGIIC